jgi:hypothetical protein
LKIYPSYWIGNRTIDIFCPQIGGLKGIQFNGRSFAGLAIEVDGGSHKNPVKQKKDLSKINFLASIGILMLSIEDDDVKTLIGHRMLNEIISKPRLDHRATQRVFHRVWLSTIAAHATDDEFTVVENQLKIKSTN